MRRISFKKYFDELDLSDSTGVWFESAFPLAYSEESLLTATLVPAMKSKHAFVYPSLSVDSVFKDNVTQAQKLLMGWNELYDKVDFSRVSIKPDCLERPLFVGCFFTGGVDSFYTFLQNRSDITHLIYIHGFDIPLGNEELMDLVGARLIEIAEEFDVELVIIKTNLRRYFELNDMEWGRDAHGIALASAGHLLSQYFKKIYIPATFDESNLMPWGSHPLLDPLWSSSTLEFVHHGRALRTEKIKVIAKSDVALKYLRVCYLNPKNSYNCGHCEKCVRTMISLEALGALGKSSFPVKRITKRHIRKLWVTSEASKHFVVENIRLLEQSTTNSWLSEDLQRLLNRPAWITDLYVLVKKKRKRFVSICQYLIGKIKKRVNPPA